MSGYTPYESAPDEEEEEVGFGGRLLIGLSAFVAIGLLVVLSESWLDLGVYHWFLRSYFGVIVFLVALPLLLAYAAFLLSGRKDPRSIFDRWRPATATRGGLAVVWTLCGVALLLGVGREALFDADKYNFENCWLIRGDTEEGVSIWECVPGESRPAEWSGYGQNTEEGSSSFCDQIDTSSSGGTIWRCERDNF